MFLCQTGFYQISEFITIFQGSGYIVSCILTGKGIPMRQTYRFRIQELQFFHGIHILIIIHQTVRNNIAGGICDSGGFRTNKCSNLRNVIT